MVGSTIINTGGRLAPGPADAPGTMMIIGLAGPANLAFQSGAIYLVQVNSTTASSVTVLERGTASLGGATVQAVFAPGIGNPAKRYTILRAAGGLNGTSAKQVETTNLPPGFTASLSYTQTDVLLNVTAALGGPQQATGLSSNPRVMSVASTGPWRTSRFRARTSWSLVARCCAVSAGARRARSRARGSRCARAHPCSPGARARSGL